MNEITAEGIARALRDGYPEASLEELENLAQTTVAEHFPPRERDAAYDEVCRHLESPGLSGPND